VPLFLSALRNIVFNDTVSKATALTIRGRATNAVGKSDKCKPNDQRHGNNIEIAVERKEDATNKRRNAANMGDVNFIIRMVCVSMERSLQITGHKTPPAVALGIMITAKL